MKLILNFKNSLIAYYNLLICNIPNKIVILLNFPSLFDRKIRRKALKAIEQVWRLENLGKCAGLATEFKSWDQWIWEDKSSKHQVRASKKTNPMPQHLPPDKRPPNRYLLLPNNLQDPKKVEPWK